MYSEYNATCMRPAAFEIAEKERWVEDQELLQRPGIALDDGVDKCVLYCNQHAFGEVDLCPRREVPLISDRLAIAWLVHMADTHRQLAWSSLYRERRGNCLAKKLAAVDARWQVCQLQRQPWLTNLPRACNQHSGVAPTEGEGKPKSGEERQQSISVKWGSKGSISTTDSRQTSEYLSACAKCRKLSGC